jgi:tetrahydromethanopterin S-methyltransferase subunit G
MSENEIIELIRRVLSRLDDIERRLKNVETDVKRVKREVRS